MLVGLLQEDYDLRIANRGEKAIRICQGTGRIDLILLDVMMPGMDGFEVCRALQSDPATCEIPILFLTAKSELESVLKGFELGGSDYLTKPFSAQELRARVRTHVTLHAQKLEIARQNATLKEMLHIVCHDVANHFAVLSMALEMAETNPASLVGRSLPYMQAAVKNGMSLTEMIREMRRSEDKVLTLQPVPLRSAVNEALLLLQGRIEAKALEVRTVVPELQVIAEPCALVNSVLCNLLTNAIKFSHPGGRIELVASVEGERVCLRVRDHGMGMSSQVLEHVFDMGRSHSRPGTQGERGTGFGMPLMRRFVTQFGGQVEVTSRDEASHAGDSGTEFRIWLKLGT